VHDNDFDWHLLTTIAVGVTFVYFHHDVEEQQITDGLLPGMVGCDFHQTNIREKTGGGAPEVQEYRTSSQS